MPRASKEQHSLVSAVKFAALIVVALLGAAAGQARGADWQPDAMFSQVGAGSATNAWSVGWQLHWRRAWTLGDSRVLRGRWDLAVGRWRRSSTTIGVTTPG